MDNILPDLAKFFKDNNDIGTRIKFTFGKYTDEFGFEAKLFNECNYEKIKSSLDSYKNWKETYEEVITEADEQPKKILNSMVIKSKGPYDILITVETDEKIVIYDENNKEINLYTYVWKRHNFVLKNYTYNIGDPIQKLEIYITDINVCKNYLAHSSILKIKDIMNICKCKNGETSEDCMEILQKK